MKKIERLLAIVLSLKQNGKMTASELADMLEVNIRTVYRDIDALSQMDVPLSALPGKDGGYEILDDYFLPSISFTRDELLALSIAKDLILNTEIPGFDPYIESAFLKIYNVISPDEAEDIEKITGRILFDLKYIDPEMEGKQFFPLIKESFEKGLCLNVGYYSARFDDVKERLVYPYFLSFADGVWYLRGKTDDKPFLWWFRLDRIKYLKLTGQRFSLPSDFKKTDYLYSHKTEGSHQVKISMERALYEIVKDDVLFKQAEIIKSEEKILLSIMTDRSSSILDFLFRNSNSAVLLGPESLLSEMKEKIQKMRDLYC